VNSWKAAEPTGRGGAYSLMSGLLLDVSALVHGAEERCKAECRRLEALVNGTERAVLGSLLQEP
jgi:hypothetical protein